MSDGNEQPVAPVEGPKADEQQYTLEEWQQWQMQQHQQQMNGVQPIVGAPFAVSTDPNWKSEAELQFIEHQKDLSGWKMYSQLCCGGYFIYYALYDIFYVYDYFFGLPMRARLEEQNEEYNTPEILLFRLSVGITGLIGGVLYLFASGFVRNHLAKEDTDKKNTMQIVDEWEADSDCNPLIRSLFRGPKLESKKKWQTAAHHMTQFSNLIFLVGLLQIASILCVPCCVTMGILFFFYTEYMKENKVLDADMKKLKEQAQFQTASGMVVAAKV
jgi:hypothetical protein